MRRCAHSEAILRIVKGAGKVLPFVVVVFTLIRCARALKLDDNGRVYRVFCADRTCIDHSTSLSTDYRI